MNLKCYFGLHDWKTEYFGGGFPMRECARCGLVQVKPLGSFYWHKAGKGTTLESTRNMYTLFKKQEELSWQLRLNQISWEDYYKEMEVTGSSFTTKDEEEK